MVNRCIHCGNIISRKRIIILYNGMSMRILNEFSTSCTNRVRRLRLDRISRENPRLFVLARRLSRLLLHHAWKSWFHSCRIDLAAYMARVCVSRQACARTSSIELYALPRRTIDVYRSALAREDMQAQSRARARVCVCMYVCARARSKLARRAE